MPHKQQRTKNVRTIARALLALAFVVAGLNHFRTPEVYLSMIPPWLPAHEMLNVISGAAEIAGGIGVLFASTRRIAAIGLILLLVAVFPANLHIAIHGWPEMDIPRWVLIARLPFQLLFIAWVVYSCPQLGFCDLTKKILCSIRILPKK